MARSGNIDIRSVYDAYLQKERQFEQEIAGRYAARNKLRHDIRSRYMHASKVSDSSLSSSINMEKSHIRNRTLLKNLEVSKARLRTYASYTPTNEELQQISTAYRNCLHKKI